MDVEILKDGAVVVSRGKAVWMLGCPPGACERLKEEGIVPTDVLLTRVSAPGIAELSPPPHVVRNTLLKIEGLEAQPIRRAHGWDLAVKSEDGSLLFTERGDVSAADVEGYDLAIIGNKHRSDAFGEHVISRPWPEGETWSIGKEFQTRNKPWSSMSEVPANLKKLDGVALVIGQVNYIARVAAGAGASEGVEEKWAVGISQFKKSHHIEDGKWVKNKTEAEKEAKKTVKHEGDKWVVYAEDGEKKLGTYDTEEEAKASLEPAEEDEEVPPWVKKKELADDTRSRMSTAFHVQFPSADGGKVEDASEIWWYLNDYDPIRKVAIVEGAGQYYEVPYLDEDGTIVFASRDKWTKVERSTSWVPTGEPPIATVVEVAGLHLLPEMMQFKEQADGSTRWFSLTTTDTWDLQGERITEKAIDWSILISTLLGERGPLLFRHFPIPLGKCDKQMRVGPLLYESGLLLDNAAAKGAVELVRKEPGQWKVSPGVRYREDDLVNGEYERLWISERSLTNVPANPTTAFQIGGIAMSKVTDELLKEAAEQLGLPFEAVKALAKQYLDASKEYTDLPEVLKELAEKAVSDYVQQSTHRASDPATLQDATAKALEENTNAIKAMLAAVKELAASQSLDRKIQVALQAHLDSIPRSEAAQFGSGETLTGDGDEETVREALKDIQKHLETLTAQPANPLGQLESMFTSSALNPPERVA